MTISLENRGNAAYHKACQLRADHQRDACRKWALIGANEGNLDCMRLVYDLDHYWDFPTAFYWLKQHAKNGNVNSMMAAARIYSEGNIYFDPMKQQLVCHLYPNGDKARKYYTMAANRGRVEACKILGDWDFKDGCINTAMQWFQKGEKRGDAYCMKRLGDLFRATHDPDQARIQYKKARKHGSCMAIWGLFCLNVCG